MPDDSLYEVALAAALGVIGKLEARPLMPRHEKLATVTYDVLDAIYAAVEHTRAGGSEPPMPDEDDVVVTVRCRVIRGSTDDRLSPNVGTSFPTLPPPR